MITWTKFHRYVKRTRNTLEKGGMSSFLELVSVLEIVDVQVSGGTVGLRILSRRMFFLLFSG